MANKQLTIQDIDKLLTKRLEENNKNLVTKDDLIENNKNLVTIDHLTEAFKANNEYLLTQMEDKFATKEDIKHLPTKEEFYASQDKLSKEIRTIREEQPTQSHQIKRNTKRIEKLESAVY